MTPRARIHGQELRGVGSTRSMRAPTKAASVTGGGTVRRKLPAPGTLGQLEQAPKMTHHQLSLATSEPPAPPKRAALTSASELSPEQNERVRSAIRYLMKTRFESNMTMFANAVRRKQPSISDILLGRKQASMETARRVAALFSESLPLAALLDSQQPFAELDADAARCPALVSALRRLEGIAPAEVVREMRTARFGNAENLTEKEWVLLIVARMQAFERGDQPTRPVEEDLRDNARRRKT